MLAQDDIVYAIIDEILNDMLSKNLSPAPPLTKPRPYTFPIFPDPETQKKIPTDP